MSTSLLEILDLGDGEVVLQRADDDSEPLVSIQFSEEASNCLLYTSPSPRDMRRSRMPSSA